MSVRDRFDDYEGHQSSYEILIYEAITSKGNLYSMEHISKKLAPCNYD